jgi:hypothetical protein
MIRTGNLGSKTFKSKGLEIQVSTVVDRQKKRLEAFALSRTKSHGGLQAKANDTRCQCGRVAKVGAFGVHRIASLTAAITSSSTK